MQTNITPQLKPLGQKRPKRPKRHEKVEGKGGKGEEEAAMQLLMREQNKISLNNQSINQSKINLATQPNPDRQIAVSPLNTIQHQHHRENEIKANKQTAPPQTFTFSYFLAVVVVVSDRRGEW